MANIIAKIAQIRDAIYGKDVRENIASGIEAINEEVESTTARQDTIDNNETIRIDAENERVILYNDLQNKVATNYYKGEKGDIGEQGPQGMKGDTGATGASGSGTGDMLTSVYDIAGNGVVDNSKKLGGKLPNEFILTSSKGVDGGVAKQDDLTALSNSVATSLAEMENQLDNIATDAIGTSIADTGNYYTSTNVEGALSEIGQTMNAMRGNLITTTNALLGM